MRFTFQEIDAAKQQLKSLVESGVTPPFEKIDQAGTSLLSRQLALIKSDPLLARYLQANRLGSESPAGFRCTLPWHAMGDRMLAAFLLAHPEIAFHSSGTQENIFPAERSMFLLRCLASQVYLWSSEVESLVRQCPLPSRVRIERNLLPLPQIFFSMEVAYIQESPAGPVEMNWSLAFECPIRDGEASIAVIGDVKVAGAARPSLTVGFIPYGSVWPDDFAGNAATCQAVGILLRRLAFINSPYVTSHSSGVPREIRREALRNGQKLVVPDQSVSVVTLRRESRPADPSHPPTSQEQVDWKHQWWVSGHFRNQYYPSSKTNRLIWVAPFVKGPPDKPILEKVYSVMR